MTSSRKAGPVRTSVLISISFLGLLQLPAPVSAQPCAEFVGPVNEIRDSFSAGPSHGYDRAQTFVVQFGGWIQAVEMYGSKQEESGLVRVDLRGIVNGTPSEADALPLIATQVPASTLPGRDTWYRIDFGPPGLAVEPGDVLALVLRYDGTSSVVDWFGATIPHPAEAAPVQAAFTRTPTEPRWRRFSDIFDPQDLDPTTFDFAFRIVTCEQAVPALPSSWGALKARYH